MADFPATNLSSPTYSNNGHFDPSFNQSIDETLPSPINHLFKLSPETIRIFGLAIGIIIVLILFTVLIYVCLRRYVLLLIQSID